MTKYKGCIVAFIDGGLNEEEAREVQGALLRGSFGAGKISQVTLSETNDEDEIVKRRAEADMHSRLVEFLFKGDGEPK